MMKKKFIAFLLLTSLLMTNTNSYKVSALSLEEKEYIVITESENEKIVETLSMTQNEAITLEKNDDVIVVEEEGYVYGSHKNHNEKGKAHTKNKEKHDKKTFEKKSKNSDVEWNMQAINVTDQVIPVNQKVKVAIIDSGIDYSTDIDVAARKNFIPNEDDVSILYEDICGHGTSVAGIVAAKDNEEGITGINPNALLYSARVLDSELRSPISRVVEAIYWAIENNVNIINISFGTTTDSQALKLAIQDAYNAGILIVAAAGNNRVVEYPAAYDEVMAVGSVDTNGERSVGSATGEELEIMAPGEQILSTGSFGGVAVTSGTSMAAPHVVGVASVLWQKDLSCTNDFIRGLLDYSSNLYGDSKEYGYGLIDLDFALSQYEAFKNVYNKSNELNLTMDEAFDSAVELQTVEINENEISTFSDVDYVEGSWGTSTHQLYAESESSSGTLTTGALAVVKLGAVANDSYVTPWTTYPQWHGFTSKQDANGNAIYYSNYMASYMYITQMALAFPNVTTTSTSYSVPSQPSYLSTDDYNNMKSIVTVSGVNGKTWATLLGTNTVHDRNKRLFVFGMALHTVTDLYAHITYDLNGKYISHALGADSTTYYPNRYKCALEMSKYVVGHMKTATAGNLNDFLNTLSVYDGTFKIPTYSGKVKLIDSTFYNNNATKLDSITY